MRVEHIGIYTTQLEALKLFYKTHFNAIAGEKYRNEKSGFESYFLTFEGEVRIELMTNPHLKRTVKVEAPIGMVHLAFKVGAREEVDRLVVEFKSSGVTIVGNPRLTGDGYYEAVVEDIDGNLIEIVA